MPPSFPKFNIIRKWEDDPDSVLGDLTCLVKIDNNYFELFWNKADEDWISWAEYNGHLADPLYGNSGNDPVENFEEMLIDYARDTTDY